MREEFVARRRLTIGAHVLAWLALAQRTGRERLLGMHRSEPNLDCLVGRGIRPALAQIYSGVEQNLREELRRTTVTDVLRDTLQMR